MYTQIYNKMLIFTWLILCFTGLPTNHTWYENGPKCEQIQKESVSQANCQSVAKSLGYKGTLHVGSWGHAPFGCFAGHPGDNWSYLYYNTRSGQTGRDRYRTFCKSTTKSGNTVFTLMIESWHKRSKCYCSHFFYLYPDKIITRDGRRLRI